jgi:hypothetical protein
MVLESLAMVGTVTAKKMFLDTNKKISTLVSSAMVAVVEAKIVLQMIVSILILTIVFGIAVVNLLSPGTYSPPTVFIPNPLVSNL